MVVGDKILLQSGDKIPADGVLLSGSLRVDNSALNGEAEECKKRQQMATLHFRRTLQAIHLSMNIHCFAVRSYLMAKECWMSAKSA